MSSIEPQHGAAAGGRVTLQIIAQRLDVSTATVSLALRDSAAVAAKTKRKVQRVAREMGYLANRSVLSRSSRTPVLAVVFHEVGNPYFAEMLSAIDETLRSSGRTILLGACNENAARPEDMLSALGAYRPDGIIVCPAGGPTEADLRDFARSGLPLVQVGREIDGLDTDFVGSDDRRATQLAVDHLVSLGHRRIAFVGGDGETPTGRHRHAVFAASLAQHGLTADPDMIAPGEPVRITGLQALPGLMALPDRPTAVVCFNDSVAFGIMHGLQRAGLTPGADMSVVGCDDVADAAGWVPRLTTIHNQHVEMGRLAAEMLMRRIQDPGRPVRRIMLEPRLVLRETTAPPAG